MNRKKPYFLKRVIAYIIDMIIVMLLASIISTLVIKNENYQNESQKLLELTANYTEGKITKEEYSSEYNDINYYLTKDSVGITAISCSVSILYFVILCYYCGGITVGKYIMKLRIVSANDKKLNIGHYLIRGLLVNTILSNITSITLVSLLNKDAFITIYPKVSSALTIFLFATLIFVMYREDGRGLHDLAANTLIISTKKDKEENKTEEVKEATVIKETKRKRTNKKEEKEK